MKSREPRERRLRVQTGAAGMNSTLGLYRHRASRLLAAETLFVARLEDARAAKQRAHCIGGLGALVEPVVGARGVEIDGRISLTGNVLSDDLDETTVARALRVCDDDAIRGSFLPPGTAETNANHVTSPSGLLHCSGLIALRAFLERTRYYELQIPRYARDDCVTSW